MKQIFCLFLIAVFFTTSCGDDPQEEGGLLIRVKNQSDYNFESVFVNTSGGEQQFGDIDAGDRTEYKTFDSAYRYAFIELKIQGKTFTLQPIDYVGENLLDPGKYTYAVNASDKGDRFTRLTIELLED